jgi:diguanylate cyclase
MAAALIIAAAYAIHVTVLLRSLGRWKKDPTTGLPVRAAFVRQARRRRRLHGAVVVFLDLDRFKQVNDSHGHGAGNTVLRVVGERLRGHFGEHAVVARLSGDEYAIVAQLGPAAGDWRDRVHAVLPVLTAPIELVPRGPQASVGASVGAVHLGSTRRPNLSGALNYAEELMYSAKFAHTGLRAVTADPDEKRVTTPAAAQPLLRLRDTRQPVGGGQS